MNEHARDEVITDLHESELLLARVVVSGGSLILLCVIRTLLVGVLVRWMNQLPGVLSRKATEVLTEISTKHISQKEKRNPVKSPQNHVQPHDLLSSTHQQRIKKSLN